MGKAIFQKDGVMTVKMTMTTRKKANPRTEKGKVKAIAALQYSRTLKQKKLEAPQHNVTAKAN